MGPMKQLVVITVALALCVVAYFVIREAFWRMHSPAYVLGRTG